MPTDIVIEKQCIATRNVIRQGIETLWWGMVTAKQNKAGNPTRNILGPFHVFAVNVDQASSRVLSFCIATHGKQFSDHRMYDAIPGKHCAYEVELPSAE